MWLRWRGARSLVCSLSCCTGGATGVRQETPEARLFTAQWLRLYNDGGRFASDLYELNVKFQTPFLIAFLCSGSYTHWKLDLKAFVKWQLFCGSVWMCLFLTGKAIALLFQPILATATHICYTGPRV